jgi:outer membrane lipoprotein LolB
VSVRSARGTIAAVWVAALLLSACATRIEPLAADTISGRLSVRVESADGKTPRTLSAAFELSGDAVRGTLSLATPLGTQLAQARWSPQRATLVTPKGEAQYPDMNTLTRELAGEALPIAAFFDWLRGRPWPDAPSTPMPPPEEGFSQLGWQVMLAGMDRGMFAAHRDAAPAVSVRAVLDRPQ